LALTEFPIVRRLTHVDLHDALDLSASAGWNQRREDWAMLFDLAPAGSFGAVIDGRVVGTAIGIDYEGFGWIAMMLVDPIFRGKGIGRRLLEAAMNALDPAVPIRLDATPAGRLLYEKYGFQDEARLTRSVARGGPGAADPRGDRMRVRQMKADDVPDLLQHDPAVFGGNRRAVLEWVLDRAPQYAHVVESGEGRHYCLGREGRLFDQIGPVVTDDDSIAQALVTAARAGSGGRPVAIDAVDARQTFSAWLSADGFEAERPLFRMCRAARQPAAGRRPPHRTRLAEFAILGPEFG
jgi:GNAT superfamily N-acetyltransferase